MTHERRDLDRTRMTQELLSMSHAQRANMNARGLRGLPLLPSSMERELRLSRLSRLIHKRTSALELALSENLELWRDLKQLWEMRRERREWAYFELGFEEGVRAQALLEGLRRR